MDHRNQNDIMKLDFRTLLDTCSDFMCITDNRGRIKKISASWIAELKYCPDEIENRAVWDFVHPDDAEQTSCFFLDQQARKNAKVLVNRFCFNNGQYRNLEWSLNSFESDYICIVRDVTERFHDMAAQERLNFFMEESQKIARIGSYDYDIQNNIWISTRTLDEIFGIDETYDRSLIGWAGIIDESDRQMMIDYMVNEVLGQRMPFNKQYRIKKISTDEVRWVHGRGTVFYDDLGNPVNMIGTIQDIDEMKKSYDDLMQMERSLFNEKERLRITFESIGDGIITVDTKRRIVSLNKAAEILTGWSRTEAEDRPFEEIFKITNEMTGGKAKNPVDEVLKKDIVCELENHTILTSRDGVRRHIADSAAPIKDMNKNTQGVVLVFRDDTFKKEAEKQLKQSAEIIEKMNTGLYLYRLENVDDDRSLKLISANPASSAILGVNKENILGQYIDEVFPKLREDGIPAKFADVVRIGIPLEEENYIYNDRNIIDSVFSYKAFKVQQDCVCVLFENVTDLYHSNEKIKFLSYHDSLTGLYNRAYFRNALNRHKDEDVMPLSVITGDVNGLKLINDIYGHHVGDKLLQIVAQTITEVCPQNSIAARFGGDEFGIILPECSERRAEEITSELQRNFTFKYCEETPVSISFGYATAYASSQIENILQDADELMYTHKLTEGKSIRNSIITSIQKTLYEKSCETEEHAVRMMDLVGLLCSKISLAPHEIDQLKLLALLHDIGKIGVDESILKKNGPLSTEEWSAVKKHPEIGYRIAMATPELAGISDLILCHHEHWDGNGYPQGLAGRNIPKLSRILSIIDAYDVMTTGRVYKKRMNTKEALFELKRCAAKQFDPELVDIFIDLLK